MITEGKGTLEEQEASKARDREKFAASAAAKAEEAAKFSERREFMDDGGSAGSAGSTEDAKSTNGTGSTDGAGDAKNASNTNGTGSKWTYAIYDSKSVHIFGCNSSATSIEIPAEIENLPVTAIHSSAVTNMPALERITIPASVEHIDKYAFKGCPNLRFVNAACSADEYNPAWFDVSRKIEELVLPNEVVELKANVFDQPLKRLVIGANTSTIAPGAFGRSKLEHVEITPDNPYLKTDGVGIYSKDGSVFLALARPVESYTVAPGTKELAKKAFSTFSCLTSVNLPDSVEVIDEFCFSRTNITEFTAPANCREIRKNAFINCRKLARVTLNDKLEVIGDEAFAVTAISELHTPKSLRHLGNRVAITTKCSFSGKDATFTIHPDCAHLKLDEQGCLYEMSDGATEGSVAEGDAPNNDATSNDATPNDSANISAPYPMILTRYLDDSITSINVAPGTTEIGESAFFKHPNLQSITLPEGVRVIGKCAFKDCEALTHVDIPDTLERIEAEAFVNTRIESIRIPAPLEHIGSMALVSAGAFRAEDAPSIQNIEVDPTNKRFYKAGSLLCEHICDDKNDDDESRGKNNDDSNSRCNSKSNDKNNGEGNDKNEGEDQVVVRDTSDHVVRFPRAVTTILPYALGGATDIEELHVSDTIKTIHMRGFSFNCHIPKVYVHLNEPIEGQSDFFFAFPNNMRGKRQLGNAFRTMKSVNVQAVYACYDLTITNSGSFGTYGKNDDDLHYQMRLIFDRLDNPIFMTNVTRETIDKIFLFNIEELGRLFTMFADAHAIDEMNSHGYIRENNVGLLCSGSFIACDDAQRKVENARDALAVVETRLKKLEGELAEAEKSIDATDDESSQEQKSVADAQKAVDSTRARAEKRRGVLEEAEKLTTNTAKVRDYILKLAHEKFALNTDDIEQQVAQIKQGKDEARKNEPANKRSYRGKPVPAGKPTVNNTTANNGSEAHTTPNVHTNATNSAGTSNLNAPDSQLDTASYHPQSAASDPALRKAIWGR